ncbi:MAG TPA: YfcC family protein [Myxococcota bacterium]
MKLLSGLTRARFPDPLALLTACVLLGAAASWLVPAGAYERREDAVTGRTVVVPGTYAAVDPQPVGPFEALLAIPRGMIDAADIVFLVFLAGGAFVVVDRTGALRVAVDALARALRGRGILVIPVVSAFFATGGALQNTQEEIIALMPVLLILVRRVGFDATTAVAMSFGPAAVGAAFSPINPFQVVIAQQLAELPVLSGGGFRLVFLLLALAVWIGGTMRYARRVYEPPAAAERAPDEPSGAPDRGGRTALVLLIVLLAFGVFSFGLLRLGWGFNEMSAVFLAMGIGAGLAGRLGVQRTAEAFAQGFREMTYAAVLVGFARAIYVVLEDGRIVDTLVHGLFIPTAELPLALAAVAMMGMQALVHVAVPSVSGQAVLTIPILTPLSDLIGLARQVTVLAYQYGAGLCELLTPTNGAFMAVLAAAGVRYEHWLRFALPRLALIAALGVVAILVGIITDLG